MPTPKIFQVDLQPIGRRAEIKETETLLAAAQSSGVDLVAICGGDGSCGTCRVRLIDGELSALTSTEEYELSADDVAAGYRLACQARPQSDVRIDIPPTSLTAPQRTQIEGQSIDVPIDPSVIPIDLQIDPPNLYDLRSDATRLSEALIKQTDPASIEYPVLTDISDRLRAQNWTARAAVHRDDERSSIVALLPLQTRLLGLAVDIGTTKLAAYLIDLSNGQTLARAGAMNPQIAYGEDVVSRIAYTNHQPEGRQILQRKLIDALNAMIGNLCAEAGAAREQIVDAVVVGNTAMHHLFAGLPVQQLGTAPYLAAVSERLNVRARDVGLAIARGANIYLPPNIAGYVGADHVSMLLASGIDATSKTVIGLDIGTNTEIGLASGGRLLCCSCASGPAFEGAHIQDGMRAAPGAIERVQITDGEIRLQTIDHQPPIGLCGSGILDAIAEMFASGILNERGALQLDRPRMRLQNGKREFVLASSPTTGHGRDVVVTGQDVSEIQLAKAAIRVGFDTLLAEAGITYEALDGVVVAGAFGTYLDLGSAIRVGMFPNLPLSRFRQVGNAAGMGAKQMLISAERRKAAAEIARRVEYIELTTHKEFTHRFTDALHLG